MTREERRARRREMATEVELGADVKQVAAKHGVSVVAVYHACREFGVKVRYHEHRRWQMAMAVESGIAPEIVAKRFGVSLQTVRRACKQFWATYQHAPTVRAPREMRASKSDMEKAIVINALKIAALIQLGTFTDKDIAANLGISLAVVHRLRRMWLQSVEAAIDKFNKKQA